MNIYVSNMGSDEHGDGSRGKPLESISHANEKAQDGDTIAVITEEFVYVVQYRECGCKQAVYQDGHRVTLVPCSALRGLHVQMDAAMEASREEFTRDTEEAALLAIRLVEEHVKQ